MKVEEAIRVLILYGSNKSSCGKLPEKEYEASRIIRGFIKELKNIETIEELKELLDEKL